MLRVIIAIVLLGHGIGHLLPFMAAWTPQYSRMGFSNAPWVFGGFTVESPVGQVWGVLGLVALIGFVGGAVGLLAYQPWWPALTIAAAAISLVTILPWFGTWPAGSMIGALVVDLGVLVALMPPWSQQAISALQ